jgi:hypothetical protein
MKGNQRVTDGKRYPGNLIEVASGEWADNTQHDHRKHRGDVDDVSKGQPGAAPFVTQRDLTVDSPTERCEL